MSGSPSSNNKSNRFANRIVRLRTIEPTKERKRDTRRKILAGACVLDRADKDPVSARHLQEILDAFLTKPQDRALFDLLAKGSFRMSVDPAWVSAAAL